METYTAMRAVADSWAMLAMMVFFVAVIVRLLMPGRKRDAQEAAAAGKRFTDSLAAGPCYMGWYYLRVTCDGRVMFCCKDKQVGHLDDGSLYHIWRDPAYQLLRLAGRDGEHGAGLFDAKCRACSNFARNREVHLALQRLSAAGCR